MFIKVRLDFRCLRMILLRLRMILRSLGVILRSLREVLRRLRNVLRRLWVEVVRLLARMEVAGLLYMVLMRMVIVHVVVHVLTLVGRGLDESPTDVHKMA